MTTHDNPMGTDGFEFIEYTAPDPKQLGALFEQMGFTAVARHRSKDVLLYRQGRINFIVNREPDSFAQSFARAVKDWPEVMGCHSLTGDMDYLLRVQVEDLDHFSRFVMDSLLKHPGVIDLRSSFVLEAVKETTALPLAHLG